MQQYGDYGFESAAPDYSRLGRPALFTPREFIAVLSLAAGIAGVVAAVLIVLLW